MLFEQSATLFGIGFCLVAIFGGQGAFQDPIPAAPGFRASRLEPGIEGGATWGSKFIVGVIKLMRGCTCCGT
jgi:hypothetical protein